MSEKKQMVPKLRFPGFTDVWEQRKLGEMGKIQSGIGFPDAEQGGTEGVPFYKVSDMNKPGNEHEMINANNYVNYEQLSRKKWKTIETVPAVIFAKVGAAIMLNRKRLVTSPFLIDNNTMAYVFDGSWDIDFGKTLFETINLPRYAQVGALPSYNGSDIESIEVTLPNKGEQVKLGAFFKSLDKTITIHQRRLEHLKKLKSGLLQKMFPKKEEKIPELRFPGFTEVWEQRKLGEVAEFSKGNGYTKKDLTENGSPIILYGRLYTKYKTVINDVDTFVVPKDRSVTSKGNEVIVPASGETSEDISRASVVGKSGFILGGDLNVIKPSILIDSLFLALTISNGSQQKEMARRAQGKSVVHLHSSDLQQINLLYPKLKEQQQIGTFFKQLDNTITLHQRKIDHLKLQKKALLQQMFI
ncbi:restriction endonuclease subunit S [Lactobacillus sp. UCMA15818]|uniref:restriction endonuclease subunit S n=1 Tax=Lactobacillus sp. UCMA15818 TaxID=2583394 RepID=UPI0025B22CC3|nr:restriction endonuclease subunit S [Lactobacillus sp. UCMA15818]MDN2453535.1 restriction endonuclease subunit S [Lactobacillus sp. UCMA15818]